EERGAEIDLAGEILLGAHGADPLDDHQAPEIVAIVIDAAILAELFAQVVVERLRRGRRGVALELAKQVPPTRAVRGIGGEEARNDDVEAAQLRARHAE